jgi:hypothetical protein
MMATTVASMIGDCDGARLPPEIRPPMYWMAMAWAASSWPVPSL